MAVPRARRPAVDRPVEAPAFEASARHAPPAEDGFAVQVGAFAQGLAAEALAESLQAKGYAAYVTPSAGDSAQRWRVRVGPIETRAEADTIARRLKSKEQLPTWVSTQVTR
jgi:cell division septation protein DedD